jgi:hypothetical protein
MYYAPDSVPKEPNEALDRFPVSYPVDQILREAMCTALVVRETRTGALSVWEATSCREVAA